MENVIPFLNITTDRKPNAALFLSGSGSNAERILEHVRDAGADTPFRVCALVTDAPDRSRAGELAATFGLPVVANDIRLFYRERGETRVALMTEAGRRIREEWTRALRAELAPFEPDFGVLAGFVPLTNLTADFPCLNVHPGDLTYLKDGERYLVGLHTVPVERAICEGLDHMRSSVIVAEPYTGSGGDMDSGPILGISEAVPLDLGGKSLDELTQCWSRRPAKRPPGGFHDTLDEVAGVNQTKLKEDGDWVVLPQVVFEFARGCYARDGEGKLLYRMGGRWHPVETVVFGRDTREVVFRGPQDR